jgi:hypothetical protein
VFPTLLYNQGGTGILRDYWYGNICNWIIQHSVPSFPHVIVGQYIRRLGGQGGKGQTIWRATKKFLIRAQNVSNGTYTFCRCKYEWI